MTIAAIPTMYAGVQFRSRLEAKWAAFFTAIGWEWQYEPIDLGGWIPDFLVRGENYPVLVEVKPVATCPSGIGREMLAATQSYDKCALLILGTGLFRQRSWLGHTLTDHNYILGWTDTEPGATPEIKNLPDSPNYFDEAYLGTWSKGVGFCSSTAGFDDRITGEYLGGSYGEADVRRFDAAWAEACNATQWKSPVGH